VNGTELENVKIFVNNLVAELGSSCFKWALTAFSNKSPILVGFGDPQSTNAVDFMGAVTGILAPSGDTDLGGAFTRSKSIITTGPLIPGVPSILLLLTDFGSDNKTKTNERAAAFAAGTEAKVCIVRMKDPAEVGDQLMNRNNELIDVITALAGTASLAGTFEFQNVVPGDAFMDGVIECICDEDSIVTPPLPTTTPPPPITTACECEADIVVVVDRTGSVNDTELENVKTFVNDLVADLGTECFNWALTAFSNASPELVGFNDAESTSVGGFQGEVTGILAPKGDTDTGGAFASAKRIINGRNSAVNEPIMLLFTDFGSDNKTKTNERAAAFAADPAARVCIVRMIDPNEGALQANRMGERDDILAVSVAGSAEALGFDFVNFIPAAGDLEEVVGCICAGAP
jgi:hypothetical protein